MAMLGQFLCVPQNFEIFHDRLFWPGLRNGVTALNSLRISGISLKFGGMMHSNMKQIDMEMAMLDQFCAFCGTLKFSLIGLDQVWGTTL